MKKIAVAAVLLCILAVAAAFLFANKGSGYDAKISLANKYIQDGRYEEAVLEYKKAIEIEPNNYAAYEGLAGAYIAMDNEKTRDGVKDTVSAYYEIAPADTRLVDFVCLRLDALSVDKAIVILNDIYEITGFDTARIKKEKLEETSDADGTDTNNNTGAEIKNTAITNADQVLDVLRDKELMDRLTEADKNLNGVPSFFVQDMNSDGKLEIFVMADGSIRSHADSADYVITFGSGEPQVYSFYGDNYVGCNTADGIFANSYTGGNATVTQIRRLCVDGTVEVVHDIISDSGGSGKIRLVVDEKEEVFDDIDALFEKEHQIIDSFDMTKEGLPTHIGEYGYEYPGFEMKEENFEAAVELGVAMAK